MASKKRKKSGSRRPSSRASSATGVRGGARPTARGSQRPGGSRGRWNLQSAASGKRPANREEARRGCLLRLVLLVVILLATVSLFYFVFGRQTGDGGTSPSPSPKASQSLHLQSPAFALLGLAAAVPTTPGEAALPRATLSA